jgi:pimeloyl-ACP methyl ester carboxylesterase
VNGIRLEYEVVGDGPAVVLLHGLTLDRRMWDDQVEALTGGYRVVRYDLRGFGQSSDPRAGEEYTHADDLRALLAHLDIPSATIVGPSMGGWVALEFTLTYPDVVDALVLADAVVRHYPFPEGWGTHVPRITQVARTSGLDEAKQLWLADPVFARSREIPQVADRLRRMVDEFRGWQFLHDNPHPLLCPPAIERLAEVDVPTLVLVGEHDHPDFQGMARLLATGIPGAELVTSAGAGHMSNIDSRDGSTMRPRVPRHASQWPWAVLGNVRVLRRRF